MQKNYKNDARLFKAFSDEKRLHILALLRDGEKCACVLSKLTGIKQTALFYHMKVCIEAGIVKARQEGKWTFYAIDCDGAKDAEERLRTVLKVNEEQTCNADYLSRLNDLNDLNACSFLKDGEDKQSACGEGKQSTYGEDKQSACGEGKQSTYGEDKQSACGEGKQSACGEGKQSACGEEKEPLSTKGEA